MKLEGEVHAICYSMHLSEVTPTLNVEITLVEELCGEAPLSSFDLWQYEVLVVRSLSARNNRKGRE